MRDDFSIRVRRAAESIRMVSDAVPSVGLILGSGMSSLAERFQGTDVPFSHIEGFPSPTVAGHRGILRLGERLGVLAGRFHSYEGHSLDNVVLPTFVLHALGARVLIVTNASGAVNRGYAAGELVLISDHLNLTGSNPLVGHNDREAGERFPDMSEAYSRRLRDLAREASGRRLKEGVYAGVTGPCFETPAEIRMLERLGADLVGMSTVPEVIAARYLGMEVLGVSCVSNMAAGVADRPLAHDDVVRTVGQAQATLEGVLVATIDRLLAAER